MRGEDKGEEAQRRPEEPAGQVGQPGSRREAKGVERRITERQHALPSRPADVCLQRGHGRHVVDQAAIPLGDEAADGVVLDVIRARAVAGDVVRPAAEGEADEIAEPHRGAGEFRDKETFTDRFGQTAQG